MVVVAAGVRFEVYVDKVQGIGEGGWKTKLGVYIGMAVVAVVAVAAVVVGW